MSLKTSIVRYQWAKAWAKGEFAPVQWVKRSNKLTFQLYRYVYYDTEYSQNNIDSDNVIAELENQPTGDKLGTLYALYNPIKDTVFTILPN